MAARYPTYHMAGINDVFTSDDDYSFIKAEGNISRQYNACSKRGLAKQIFHCFMKKAMEDIVEENLVFQLPLYRASILIEEIPSHILKKRKSEGKLLHFSDVFAHGKGYDMIYRHVSKGKYRKRRVIMHSSLFSRFVSLVNTGKRYFGIAKAW